MTQCSIRCACFRYKPLRGFNGIPCSFERWRGCRTETANKVRQYIMTTHYPTPRQRAIQEWPDYTPVWVDIGGVRHDGHVTWHWGQRVRPGQAEDKIPVALELCKMWFKTEELHVIEDSEEEPEMCIVCGGLEPCSHNFDEVKWPTASSALTAPGIKEDRE